ncbi:hypothetical protein ACG7TL_001999 [Trametes sanguinea]
MSMKSMDIMHQDAKKPSERDPTSPSPSGSKDHQDAH